MSKKYETKKIEELENSIKEWKEKYLRALADYQNLEKRILQVRESEIKSATKNFVLKILPILDILEKAANVIADQGLFLAIKQFKEVLLHEKVEKLEVLGKKYDPHTMECIEVIEGDKDDEVIGEIRSGYSLNGKIIRVAQVKVCKIKVRDNIDHKKL